MTGVGYIRQPKTSNTRTKKTAANRGIVPVLFFPSFTVIRVTFSNLRRRARLHTTLATNVVIGWHRDRQNEDRPVAVLVNS